MKIDSICRVCLKEGKFKSIYDIKKIDEDKNIIQCAEMFLLCTSMEVEKMDGYPGHICKRCFEKLWAAYKFRTLCQKSHEQIKNYLSQTLVDVKIESLEVIRSDDEIKTVKSENESHSVNVNCCLDEVKIETEVHSDEDFKCDDSVIFGESIENGVILLEKNDEGKKVKKSKKKSKKCVNGEGWKCEYCPKVFKYQYMLLSHEDTHFGIKRYFCELCQKAYRSEKDHRNMHKRGFKFKCEICSKSYSNKGKLTIHIDTHNSNKEKMICGLNGCTKQYATSGGLKKHQSQHDGVKNFVCHICSKKFIDKFTLGQHIKYHNNEKKYQCSFCSKKFLHTGAKNLHERRHTNSRNHPCTNCDQSFYTPASLRRHFLSHSKILKEACRFCSKRFSRRDNRRRHESVMHGVSESEDKSDINIFRE